MALKHTADFGGFAFSILAWLFLTGAITCTDVDMHKIVSGSNDRTVKVCFCTPLVLRGFVLAGKEVCC